jgi:hypothetical protein
MWNMKGVFQKYVLQTSSLPKTQTVVICITCFSEAYPEMEIQDIQLAYNISRVIVLDKER